MKIAFLNFYGGHTPRGIETFVFELANRLSVKNEVTVYQCGPILPGSKYKTEVINVAADWNRINEVRHLSTILFFDFDFRNLLRRLYLDYWSLKQKNFAHASLNRLDLNTDVVVSVGSGWISFLSRLWCWRHGSQLIISAQSGPGWDDRINLLCRPDVFVALTKYQSNWAKRNGFGVKIAMIPNGVDLQKFNPGVKPLKTDLPRPIFLCVAALEPGKHVDQTIRAVSNLPRGSLIVLGSGKLKDQLVNLAAKLLPGRFLLANVPHHQIAPYYTACDVATMLPPLTESFGIVFLEAMASNRPVVTSDDPPRREIVGNGGLFVDFEKPEEYAPVLQKTLKTKWGNLPRKQAEKFSWDKIAAQYEDLFKSQ